MKTHIISKIAGFSRLLRQVYTLVRPYGLRKLIKVLLVSVLQAVSQVISVAAIFPFLALAADSRRLAQSRPGQWLMMLFPDKSYEQLLVITGICLIVTLFAANGASMYGEFYRARFTWGFAHWLRMRMLYRMNSRSYGWFLQQNSSVLIKKTTQDVVQFIGGVLSPIIDGFSRLLVSVFLLATIVIAEPLIAFWVALVLGITYLLIFVLLGQFRINLSNNLKIHWRGLFQGVGQFFSGIKPVKVHGVSSYFLDSIEGHSRQQSQLQAWMPIIGNGPRYLIEPLIAALMIVLVVQSLFRGQKLAVLLPNLGLIAMAGYRLLPAVQMIYGQLSNIQSMRYALDEVYDEFSEAEKENGSIVIQNSTETMKTRNRTVPSGPFRFTSAITLQGVSFSYPESKDFVLRDITLTIRKNTSVAFIGETGSGKSTLVDLILGLHLPTTGQLLIDDQPLNTEEQIRDWQHLIGYVPQDIFLTDDTIAGNIAFGIPDDERDDDRLREVVAMAQLKSFVEDELLHGYETAVGERGVRLSGGQRQRIALARALYHRPEVLILDEATSSLDNETEKRFMETIYSLSDKVTLLMIAHRMTTTNRCDFKYVVKSGQCCPTV